MKHSQKRTDATRSARRCTRRASCCTAWDARSRLRRYLHAALTSISRAARPYACTRSRRRTARCISSCRGRCAAGTAAGAPILRTAVELFAALCKQYGLDPAQDGVIIGHAEGHRRGVASNHADPELLWRTYDMGYKMDGFRADVAAKMAVGNTDEEDDDMVRYNKIEDVPAWARSTIKEMMNEGLIAGTGGGRLDLSDDMLRMLYIMWHMRDTRYGRIVDGKVTDVPAWALDSLQALVDKGVLAGVGGGKLDLSMDMLRTLVIAVNMDK